MRNWITIVAILVLLIGGGMLLVQLQSGEPLTLTSGYVPQLDSTQAFLLAGAVGFLVISTLGMGATLAAAAWFGGRQIATAQAELSQAEAGAELREPSKAAPKPGPARNINWGGAGRAAVIAANVLVIGFVAFLTLNHFVLNPPVEEEFAPELPNAVPTQAPPPAPGDIGAAFAALPAGDAGRGQTTFTSQPCASCHSLVVDQVLVGPSLAGVATRAETREPGRAAGEYIYESIVHPSAYVVAGFQDGLMPQNFGQLLTPQQQADLVAFLLTQR